jgi:hypothetical protein
MDSLALTPPIEPPWRSALSHEHQTLCQTPGSAAEMDRRTERGHRAGGGRVLGISCAKSSGRAQTNPPGATDGSAPCLPATDAVEAAVDGFAQDYLGRLSRVIERCDLVSMDRGVEMVRQAWESGRQIITLGNGGSAMTALRYITDWNKMIYLATGRPFRGRTLVDNMGLLTAYSNDISYQDVFLVGITVTATVSHPDCRAVLIQIAALYARLLYRPC